MVKSAAREIPAILANAKPQHDGTVEMIASHLAERLQDAKHTLAAAHWAIHELVREGRLEAGRIEMTMPMTGRPVGRRGMFGMPDTRQIEWTGGERVTIAIPKDKPAPFDAFKVVATESLWKWWRSLDVTSSPPVHELVNQSDRAPAVTQTEETPAIAPGSNALLTLMRVFTNGIADDRIEKAARLLADNKLTADEKLTKIDALIPIPATASAEQLGEMLDVTKQAVLKTGWWIQNRKGEKDNEVGRRREGHRKRAKSHEAPGQEDEDD
jgi:hypothetical protein